MMGNSPFYDNGMKVEIIESLPYFILLLGQKCAGMEVELPLARLVAATAPLRL